MPSKRSSPNSDKDQKKGGTVFHIAVAAISLLAAGAGFATGFSQSFVPIEGGASGLFGTGLKHQYFLDAHCSTQPPYSINVFINGQPAGSFPNAKIVEVTSFVLKGRNKIRFEAKKLPESMYAGNAWFELKLLSGKRVIDGGYKDGQPLITYARSAGDKVNYQDEMDWETTDE